MAIPKYKKFKEIVIQKRGNLSKIAEAFSVDRCTIYDWIKTNAEYKQLIDDARGRLFDDCLVTAEVVAMGIPEKDEQGKFIGWRERPDGNMLRYLMSTLGKREGFGESLEIDLHNKITTKSTPEEAARFFKELMNECEEK